MSDLRNAAERALSALIESVDLVQNDYDTDWQHRSPSRAAQMDGKRKMLEAHTDAITALRTALENEFNPDWDQVEALQESLREHMAEIQRLRAMLAEHYCDTHCTWLDHAPECVMAQTVQAPLEPDIAKIVNDNLWSLYVEDPAEPAQEPVAWMDEHGHVDHGCDAILNPKGWTPLYTTPPQRKPLTEEEIYLGTNQIDRGERGWAIKFARAIERAHGITE